MSNQIMPSIKINENSFINSNVKKISIEPGQFAIDFETRH